MAIEISILSGNRQGDSVRLPDGAFEVGSLPTDAVCFDPKVDPSVVGHRAALWPSVDGWCIRSTGPSPIMVNHDAVKGTRAVRSGDIIRMSEDGPDFAFALIGRLTLQKESAPRDQPQIVEPCVAFPEPPATIHNDPVSPTAMTPTATPPINRRWIAVAIGILCTALAWTVLQSGLQRMRLASSKTTPAISRPFQLGPIEVLAIDEGQTLSWRPLVLDRGIPSADLNFELGDTKPDGMDIDSETGTIRWTPTEQQGPLELKVPLVVTASENGGRQTTTETLFLVVNEVNQPPIVKSIPSQTINLRAGSLLVLTVEATDYDAPAQQLTYVLRSAAPEGMMLDGQSGKLTWHATETHANQEFTITICVSDDAAVPLAAETDLHVSVISPDPLDFAASRLRDVIYLVGAQPAGLDSFYPLGTACAIAEHLLVTNAAVATGVAKARQVQWNVVVVQAANIGDRRERAIPITETRVHKAYTEAPDAAEQAFFDLGLLTVSQSLSTICPLASDRELAEVSINQTFGCFGFTIEESALTRFDNPIPELRRLRLNRVLFPEGGPGPVRLLELVGEIPPLAYGSVIMNSEGKLLGVYAIPGQSPEQGASGQELHYAPVATLVALRIKEPDADGHWVAPKLPSALSDKIN